MAGGWRRWGRRDRLPRAVDAALGLASGERVMAWGRDERTQSFVVATTSRLVVVADEATRAAAAGLPQQGTASWGDSGATVLARPWHEVEGGAWEPHTATISVSWVDGGRASQWTLRTGGDRFSAVFYERVAASVVVDAPVERDGRPLGRVAIRRDLATGDLLRQTSWGRGVRHDDPATAAAAARLLDTLAEQSGLD